MKELLATATVNFTFLPPTFICTVLVPLAFRPGSFTVMLGAVMGISSVLPSAYVTLMVPPSSVNSSPIT